MSEEVIFGHPDFNVRVVQSGTEFFMEIYIDEYWARISRRKDSLMAVFDAGYQAAMHGSYECL